MRTPDISHTAASPSRLTLWRTADAVAYSAAKAGIAVVIVERFGLGQLGWLSAAGNTGGVLSVLLIATIATRAGPASSHATLVIAAFATRCALLASVVCGTPIAGILAIAVLAYATETAARSATSAEIAANSTGQPLARTTFLTAAATAAGASAGAVSVTLAPTAWAVTVIIASGATTGLLARTASSGSRQPAIRATWRDLSISRESLLLLACVLLAYGPTQLQIGLITELASPIWVGPAAFAAAVGSTMVLLAPRLPAALPVLPLLAAGGVAAWAGLAFGGWGAVAGGALSSGFLSCVGYAWTRQVATRRRGERLDVPLATAGTFGSLGGIMAPVIAATAISAFGLTTGTLTLAGLLVLLAAGLAMAGPVRRHGRRPEAD